MTTTGATATSLPSKGELNNTLRWIAAQPDERKITHRLDWGGGSFAASAWNKFDMYEGIAFDTRPVLVAPPFTPISLVDGLGCVLPTEIQGMAEDRGDDDVAARLERAALGSPGSG
jgi:hypothetical protein